MFALGCVNAVQRDVKNCEEQPGGKLSKLRQSNELREDRVEFAAGESAFAVV
jgi:hypothetical protein